KSCSRKSTPLACRRLATHLVQPARRPPVAGEGNRSGEVLTGAPAMTARISGVSGTSCWAPVLACSGCTTMRSATRSPGAPALGTLAAAQPGEQGQADQAAEGAEAAGRLPQLANLVVGKRASAVGSGFEPLGA